MDGTTKISLAAAVAGGYVLGRTKRGRLALTVALALAGRGLGGGPRELAAEGARWLGEVPQVAALREQVGQEGADAARKTVNTLVERSVGSLADVIASRAVTTSTQRPDDAAAADQEQSDSEEPEDSDESDEAPEASEDEDQPYEGEDDAEDGTDDADADQDADQDDEPEEEPPAPRSRTKRTGTARKTATTAKSAKAPRTAKTSERRAPAKRTATRKTASRKQSPSAADGDRRRR